MSGVAGRIGALSGTGQRWGNEIRPRKSPDGLTSVIESVSPLALIPETWAALPAKKAGRPSIAGASLWPRPPLPSFGEKARSSVCLNVAAVTASWDGGEKRKPRRMRNVYVRPRRRRAASKHT